MDDHIEVMKKAIEFGKPSYLPMETVDVPFIYNAYHTLDPKTAVFVPGAERCDALWTNCYSWFWKEIKKTPEGERVCEDQFGTLLKVPRDMNSAYTILKNPLADKNSLKGFEFPDPDDTDPHFNTLGETIKTRYNDRFIDGFIDAGIFLTTMFLFGEERFLINTVDNLGLVLEAYERVMEYYKSLVLKYKRAGAHMITEIEDIGGTGSLLISPEVWRKHFKPLARKFFKFVHEQNLYTGMLIDGNCTPVLDDLPDMEIDVFNNFDNHVTGMRKIKDRLRGRMCVKATVDMQTTLPLGTPEEVSKEANELVNAFNTPDGGFICEVVRWHRPSYPEENARASARAFNEYRRNAGAASTVIERKGGD